MSELFTADEVRSWLRVECEEAGSQKAWALKHGLSPAYVSDACNGRRDAGDGVARALGFDRVVLYRARAAGIPVREIGAGEREPDRG